jgi:predicted MPP superfamily phosphohydrolase
MPYKIHHTPGFIVSGVVLAAQLQIAWFLEKDWKHKLPSWSFPALKYFLCGVWFITASGTIIDLLGLQYFSGIIPRTISTTAVAIATLWGFTSAISIVFYALCRYALKAHRFSPGRRTALKTVAAATMAAPFVLTGFGAVVERTAYVVTEVDLPIPNLHPDLEGLRFAQISDLHVSPFLSVREAGRVVDITNELKPNLTLVTGDLISQRGDPLDGTIRELGRLRADAGVLGCLGNHEVYANCQTYATREAARVGIHFLRQEAVQLRWGSGTLNIAGVDFQPFNEKKNYLRGAERLVAPGVANLLLSHNPDVFPIAVRKGYDAMLSGHTHGGQVTVEILNQTANFARFFTHYVAGLYRLEGRSCYVNAGIGTIGMPVRLGAPPEITLFRLRRA